MTNSNEYNYLLSSEIGKITQQARAADSRLLASFEFDCLLCAVASQQGPNGTFNYLIDLVLDVPATRAMYLRRLRTLMDFWLNGRIAQVLNYFMLSIDAYYEGLHRLRYRGPCNIQAWSGQEGYEDTTFVCSVLSSC